ncbi:hypothetical protein M2O13_004838 [Salmonella enterica subsp. enterica serovar Typhimurium]|nr:hypothetical protein [Salmonella enterica subsp. enterica serovar Typhimurium]
MMTKTNDWVKSGTSNHGDETRYTLHGGWFMSYTKSLGEVSVRAPDGTFTILDTDEPVTSAIAAKRLAADHVNRNA